jgi:hypothetical protein
MKVIRSGAQIKYYHIKASDGPLAKGTLLYTSSKTSNANTKTLRWESSDVLESLTGLLMPLKSILLPSVSTISDKKMLRLLLTWTFK